MNSLEAHKEWRGKIEIVPRAPISNRAELSLAYTPGVAEPCLDIVKHSERVYDYTRKNNLVAVVTDGSAVLGLGNIGAAAGLPVMEGKCALFKTFADVDAFPIAINSQDVEEIVRTVELIAPIFGGINLEDISAPRCFEVEERLKERLDIPVFHDDQHGTAIVILAALKNALKVVDKDLAKISIVINGVGAAGVATAKMLLLAGAKNVFLVDSHGLIFEGRADDMNPIKLALAKKTNLEKRAGSLEDAVRGADVFIGVSKAGLMKPEWIKSMAAEPIIFALANPAPEIMPDEALAGGAAVVATGRSDFPNQINNVLAFPGIFRGALDARVKNITEEMKLAAAEALSVLVEKPTAEKILPDPFDRSVVDAVAAAVKARAI